jgi:hypothetical protein
MEGKIRTGTNRWYIGAAVCILVILVMAAGCNMAASPPPGNDNGGSGGGENGGSSHSVGDTGTETWQATFSVTENDHTTMALTRVGDTASTQKEEATSTLEFHGTFPVVMAHERTSEGDHYYIPDRPDKGYPASGSFESHDHVASTGQETGCHPMAFETFDQEQLGSISLTNFDFAVEGPKEFVQVDNSFPTTIETKDVFSDPKDCPNSEETTTQNGGTWYQCHSDTPNPDDTFPGGTHDFHREGSRYVILCHAMINTPYNDDAEYHYDPSSMKTEDITLKITMDPDYVQGTATPTSSPTPTIPEPTLSLAPLEPTVSLAPREPTVSLAPLAPTVSLAPLVTPEITLAPLVTPTSGK